MPAVNWLALFLSITIFFSLIYDLSAMLLSIRIPTGNTVIVLPFITEISLFQTSSCMPVLLWLCLHQWIQRDKAKGLSTSPWLPLTFGCQQAPGSRADGCLWACLHCLGMASKCQEPFSHARGSPETSHPSQSLPLPHIREPPHLIHDHFNVNMCLYIFTQCFTTVHCCSCFSPLNHNPGALQL